MSDDKSKQEGPAWEDVNRFEKLADRAREIFEESRDKSSEAFNAALDRAKQEMVAAGEFSAEIGERLRQYVERDLYATRRELDSVVGKFRSEAERVGVGMLGLMQSLAAELGGLLSDAASSMQDRLTYRTGEICGPGTLSCTKCKKELRMKKTGHIPPCPACAATEFHRSY